MDGWRERWTDERGLQITEPSSPPYGEGEDKFHLFALGPRDVEISKTSL